MWRHRWRHHYKSYRNWKSCIWSYDPVIFVTIRPRGGVLEQFETFSCHGSKSPPRGRIISKFLLYLVKIFIFLEKWSKVMIHTYGSRKNNFPRKIWVLFLRIGFFACFMRLNAYSYKSFDAFWLAVSPAKRSRSEKSCNQWFQVSKIWKSGTIFIFLSQII